MKRLLDHFSQLKDTKIELNYNDEDQLFLLADYRDVIVIAKDDLLALHKVIQTLIEDGTLTWIHYFP